MSYAQKSWQNLGSYPNTDTNPQKKAWIETEREIKPKRWPRTPKKFSENFDWIGTLATKAQKQAIQDILVEIFERQRVEMRLKTQLNVKLTRKEHKTFYSQSLPMLFHLQEGLIIELALMHKFGIITVMLFSKYTSPNFVLRKPYLWISGK